LLPSAAGTVNAPPLIRVPVGAVTRLATWHVVQPIWANSASPARESAVAARAVSRGGALVERMKLAKRMRSSPSSSGSATPSLTTRPFEVLSLGNIGVVMPISFR
jgi:hypothetical protein